VGGCGLYDSALRWGVAICLGIDVLVGAIDRILSGWIGADIVGRGRSVYNEAGLAMR
jgi:hypothetical protein